MKRYIFITEGLNKLDILLKSINEETVYKISNSVSLENLEELQDCSNIGFIYHNSKVFPFYNIDQTNHESDNYFQNISSDFWNKIKELKLVVDLITCNLNQDYQIRSINSISEEYGIHFRYSIDQTGNSNVGGNWILENSTDISQKNTDIKNLYFNDEINNWDVILSTKPKIISYSVSNVNTILFVIDTGIPNSLTEYYDQIVLYTTNKVSDGSLNTQKKFISSRLSGIERNISLDYSYHPGAWHSIRVELIKNGSWFSSNYTIDSSPQKVLSYLGCTLSFSSFYRFYGMVNIDYVKYNVSIPNLPTNIGDYYSSYIHTSFCGFCYSSINKIPTVDDNKSISTNKWFSSSSKELLLDLLFGKIYYIRFFYKVDKGLNNDDETYAENTGIYYSNVHVIPTCLEPIINPIVNPNTGSVDFLVSVSMSTPEPIEYGICWGTVTGPTINNTIYTMGKNVSGSLNSSYKILSSALLPYKTYYIKTYVKYGDVVYYSFEKTSFTTKPNIITGTPTFESNSTAIILDSKIDLNQTTTIERGVCWSIYPNPTTLYSKSFINLTTNSSHTYTTQMNLLSDEIYYIRAYTIINSITYYGDQRIYTHTRINLSIDDSSIDISTKKINVKWKLNLDISKLSSYGICYDTSNKLPISTDNQTITTTTSFDLNQTYYVRFFYNTIISNTTKTFYSNVFLLPVFYAPIINNIYSKSVNINISNLNIGDEIGICWSKVSSTVTTDFYAKLYSNTTHFSLTSLSPSTTYYLKSYIKINSIFFYSYDTLTFKTTDTTNNNIIFPNPTTLFNNKSYTGNYKLNLSGSNLSNLNLSEYYMGGINLENANFDNITTKNILGQPILSSGYKNNYGFIVGKNINMINPVITQDMKDIFYNVDLTNSNIIDATIVSDCLVASTVYDNTTFTSTNIIYKKISDKATFFYKRLMLYNMDFTISIDDINTMTDQNIEIPDNIKTTLIKTGPQTFVKTRYGILINNSFLLQWNGSDLSDMDISECRPLSVFDDTSFKNILSNSNTKLPPGFVIINKYIIGPRMRLINVDFENVFADLNIDLTEIISGGILNYDNISFSGSGSSYTMIKNETSIFESIQIRRGGIIVGPNTNFKNIVFKESDLSPLKLINVLFDSCNFIGCFGKVNTAVNVKFVNCNYEIIGGYIVGPNVSLENANFQNNSHFISVSLRNVSSKNIQNYANVGFKNNIYQIINGCIFGKEVNVKDVEFNGQTVNVDLTDIISSNIRGTLKFNNNRYFLLEGFIVGPKVHYETIKITNDHSKNVLLNLFSENTTGVAVGNGSHTIAYSYDGITWTGLGKTIFSTRGYGIAYNGSLWVAVGEGTNSIAYSSNGFTWDTLGVGFMSVGKNVAWNGVNWFILGDDSFGATSTDGITWNKFSIDLLVKGRAVIWSGTSWLIVGDIHATIGTTGTSGIIYSTDGSNWNVKETGFSCSCYGVAWDGTKTVVVGEYTGGNGGGSILYSIDDNNWVATGENIFSTRVNGVASNGTGGWVAVGEGTNTIAYSTSNNDGSMTWTAINNILFSVGKSVSWNKKYWVAVGEGRNSIAYSTDGIKWTGAGTDIFSSGENLAWDGILTSSSISNYSDSDQENIINIIHSYDPNAKLPIQLDIDTSNDILITPETFQGSTSATKYYPNFNVNNKLTLYLNDNEYIKITKLWKTTKNQTINIFYKYTKFEKILGNDIVTFNTLYNKGQTLKIKKYKIVLQ